MVLIIGVADAIHMTVFSNNMWWFPIFINRGDLDYYLIRPVSSLFFLSLRDYRNFAEILRLLDSVQLTATEQVATPANWEQGDDVIILPSVSNDDAKARYPDGWEQPLPYIRVVPQPKK